MGKQTETGITWTHFTFNPWMGCVKISPACKFCYAEADRKMRGQLLWGPDAPRQVTSEAYWKQPLKWDREAREKGIRYRVFCGSLCDVMEDYHGMMSCSWADQWTMQDVRDCALYPLIEQTPNLDWMLLTKRPENYRRFLPQSWLESPRSNVWGMTTVESQDYIQRAVDLAGVPFAVRGLSCEPLLGPLDLVYPESLFPNGPGRCCDGRDCGCMGQPVDPPLIWNFDLVICGGESGSQARPMQAEWARSLRDQCREWNRAFHFKQWGEYNEQLVKIGKHNAGRLLDGHLWDQMPEAHHV